MKILYLITELDIGGAERILYYQARGMAQRGHQVEAACLVGRGEVGQWLEREGIAAHYLDASPARPWRFLFPLRRVVRRLSPDVLHAHLFHANLVGRFVGWMERVPAVVCTAHVEDGSRPWRLRLDRWTQRMMHVETCVSEAVRQFTLRAARVSEDRLLTIPNVVDVSRFDLPRGTFRAELGVSDREVLIVTVGRLTEQKGYGYLVDAAARVLAQRQDVVFAVVGAGPEEENLREQARGLGLKFRFMGWRRDIPQILVDADLYVSSSLWEGMPLVVLEAMAARCPVVATRVSGTPEVVVDPDTGLLVPPRDAVALAEAVLRFLSDPAAGRRAGDLGRQRAEEEFGLGRMLDRNESLYRRLLESHAGARS